MDFCELGIIWFVQWTNLFETGLNLWLTLFGNKLNLIWEADEPIVEEKHLKFN